MSQKKPVQVILEKGEIKTLKHLSRLTGKSQSLLIREAIDATYRFRFSEEEFRQMAGESRLGRGIKRCGTIREARRYLWSL